jgi:hypothetical protein
MYEEDLPFTDQYVLWFHEVVNSSWDKASYQNLCTGMPENGIRSGKQLWRVYKGFGGNITAGMFFLMRDGIFPQWEDPANAKGGFWSFKVPKRCANEVWCQLSAAFCGNTLMRDSSLMKQITGISCSPKISNCVMKIWNRSARYKDPKLLNTEVRFLDPSLVLYRKHAK